MTGLGFIVLSLATLRISYLLMAEEGPFEIFTRLRSLLKVTENGTNYFSKMFACLWCTSLNVAAVLVVCVYLFPVQTMFVSYVLAASAVAIVLDAVTS